MAEFKVVEVKDAGGVPLHTMMNVDGHRITTFMKPPEVTAEIIHNLVNMSIRDDDIMFCSGPKSGTHWGFEIISMLRNGKAESIPIPKEATMLEVRSQTEIDEIPPPRVLNSHFQLSLLPKQLKEKKTKIVLALRNLKDLAVSFYHHHKGITFYDYNGKFEDYLPLLLKGELEYGDWFDYVKEWENEINKADYKIHLVFFEDLKENGLEEIKKIAEFLGVPQNDELCQAIYEKCHFDKMAKDKTYPKEMTDKYYKNNFSMYRKGQIGDWKNYFTVAMSEDFDKLYNEKMKGSKLKFRFSPSV